MKTPPNQTAFESAPDKANYTSNKFSGTDNPRHLRAIQALMTRPQRREHLDRDGRPIRRGVYHLLSSDRRKINAWMRERDARRCA